MIEGKSPVNAFSSKVVFNGERDFGYKTNSMYYLSLTIVNTFLRNTNEAGRCQNGNRRITFYRSPEGRMIVELINSRRDINYLNHNYANALCLAEVMFRNASKRICILSGERIFDILNILGEPFNVAYRTITQNQGKIQIISLGVGEIFKDRVSSTYGEFAKLYPAVEFKAGIITDPLQVSHYMICDNDVRIEHPHWKLTGESSANALHATVYFNASKTEVDRLEQKFLGFFLKL